MGKQVRESNKYGCRGKTTLTTIAGDVPPRVLLTSVSPSISTCAQKSEVMLNPQQTQTSIIIYIYISLSLSIYIYIYMCMYVYVYKHNYIYIYIYIHVYVLAMS